MTQEQAGSIFDEVRRVWSVKAGLRDLWVRVLVPLDYARVDGFLRAWQREDRPTLEQIRQTCAAPKAAAHAGCRRCRGTGAVEMRVWGIVTFGRCTCEASAKFCGLPEVDAFYRGRGEGEVIEWPTIAERREGGA